jgi:D-alanine-D-alanine ligase
MHIALTYDSKTHDSEPECELDEMEVVDALATALARAGHEVERVEVTGSVARLVARLEASTPDLIVNIATGRKGRTRSAFYPSLFEELGIPFIGSDAHTLEITRDKMLTRRILSDLEVPTPPVLAKVIERSCGPGDAGLSVEPSPRGAHVACMFVDGIGDDGVLAPVEYTVGAQLAGTYDVHDHELRNRKAGHVMARPADLPAPVIAHIQALTRRIVRAVDLKDFGRCEFRVMRAAVDSRAAHVPEASGYEVYFLGLDALPALGPGGDLFVGARERGVEYDGVVGAIVRSACRRYGIGASTHTSVRPPRKSALRVGLTFNVRRIDSASDDVEAEFDPPHTIAAVAAAIESFGHTVVKLEANADLPRVLTDAAPDVVFNIAEGSRGRGREAHVPALCELLGIPYSGSDATTLSLCLDKGLTKQILRSAGIDTAEWQVMTTGREKLKAFRYPVIVKPNAEGTSKGITSASVVTDEGSLRAAVKALVERYHQPALVEEYISGREFTVGLLGERRPKVLPVMEVVFVGASKHPVYGFEEKLSDTPRVRLDCPAQITPAEQKRIEKTVRDTFAALDCRDVARIDLRMATDGTIYVIEINPLPGLTPDFSDLCAIAKAAGMDHRTLIGEILGGSLKRYREARSALPREHGGHAATKASERA